MGRAFTLSLAWHAALILSFLLLSGTRAPLRVVETVRPIRLVTYIEAPPRPAAGRAPRPVAPETPARAAPARPAPPAAPETLEAPAPRPAPQRVAVPRVLVPKPQTAPAARPTRPAPQPPAAENALRERLSRRLAATTLAEPAPPGDDSLRLASLPPAEEPPSPRPLRAAPASAAPGAGAAVVPVGDFPHAWYLALLKEQLYTRWTPPSEFFSGARGAFALVGFRIDRGGRVSGIVLRRGSGSARYDQSALAAVQGLPRVPALPQQYAEETLDVVIRFQNEE